MTTEPSVIEAPVVVRTCRNCGCTDADCSRCIARTGAPCHWVEANLCSACEEFVACLRDTSRIRNREHALAIIAELDDGIASIQGQIDGYGLEAASREMPVFRQNWLRRALYARAIKLAQRQRVMQRDKEFRGIKGPAQPAPRQDPAEKLAERQAKQVRFLAEIEVRKAAKAAELVRQQGFLADAGERRSFGRMFVNVARERLDGETFTAWSEEARRRRKLDAE